MRCTCSLAGRRESFTAALRHRLLAPIRDLSSLLECPGCSKSFNGVTGKRDWQRHVVGCARISGRNVSSTHVELKNALKSACADCNVPFASAEPRVCRTITCACKTHFKVSDFDAHSKSCTAFQAQPDFVVRSSGPDIEVFLADDNASSQMVDVTVVAAESDSHRDKTLNDVFKPVTERK